MQISSRFTLAVYLFMCADIFATQGDYGEIQCEKSCHPKVYLPDYF